MCTSNDSNIERFDKVIAKIKWYSFLASQCTFTFVRISEILAGITGNFASFVFFQIFIVDYDILVCNLTAF